MGTQDNWFSNFREYPKPVICSKTKIVYKTPEHLFQAMKTLDTKERRKVAACSTPGQAKRMGRSVTLRADWEKIKVDVMVYAQTKMCERDEEYLLRLLKSRDEELIEWNTWHDNVWGTCTCSKCKNKSPKNLMQVALLRVKETFS